MIKKYLVINAMYGVFYYRCAVVLTGGGGGGDTGHAMVLTGGTEYRYSLFIDKVLSFPLVITY